MSENDQVNQGSLPNNHISLSLFGVAITSQEGNKQDEQSITSKGRTPKMNKVGVDTRQNLLLKIITSH